MNTVGVNKPTDFLDFGDTFVDQLHLQDSFGAPVSIEGSDKLEENKRHNFKVRFTEEKAKGGSTVVKIEAASAPHPEKSTGNPVRFTPVQVEAIRSGLSPGLTLVVGPPGTGTCNLFGIISWVHNHWN